MPSNESIQQANLKIVLDLLLESQQRLIDRIREQTAYPLFVQDIEDEQARIKLMEHISLFEYQDSEMKSGQTVVMQAVCGTNSETLQLVTSINEQRASLQKQLIKMDKMMVRDASNQSIRLSVYAMQRLGYARFNRRQTVRRFNVFNAPLSSISFFWASQRKVIKASVQTVRDDLVKKIAKSNSDYGYHLKADLAQLNELTSEEDLYYVYLKNDNPRVNYVLMTEEGQKRGSCMASSPFFYLAEENPELPRIRELPLLSQRVSRLSRIDKIIDDTPFLSSIHVHRLSKNKLKN